MKLLFIVLIGFICLGFCPLDVSAQGELPDGQRPWIDGKLPAASREKGDWQWDSGFTHDGSSTHMQSSLNGLSRSRIIQYVYLDPDDIPSGIMIRFFLVSDDELVVYWEGREEVFSELNEYITAWYMGFMPDPGVWLPLIIDCRELDISNEEIKGAEFIVGDGRLWWGKTIVSIQED